MRITGESAGHGTGFVVRRPSGSASALVVTCAHVVADLGPTLRVNGRPASITYDGTSHGVDLAVLEIDDVGETPALRLAAALMRGDRVIAVGWGRTDQGAAAEPSRGAVAELTSLTYPAASNQARDAYRLALEPTIKRGYSGGPVIDERTGTVAGVLRMREGDTVAHATAIGGLAGWPGYLELLNSGQTRQPELRPTNWLHLGTVLAVGLVAVVVVNRGCKSVPSTCHIPGALADPFAHRFKADYTGRASAWCECDSTTRCERRFDNVVVRGVCTGGRPVGKWSGWQRDADGKTTQFWNAEFEELGPPTGIWWADSAAAPKLRMLCTGPDACEVVTKQ